MSVFVLAGKGLSVQADVHKTLKSIYACVPVRMCLYLQLSASSDITMSHLSALSPNQGMILNAWGKEVSGVTVGP